MSIHRSSYTKYEGPLSTTPTQQICRIVVNEYKSLIQPASAKGLIFLVLAGYLLLAFLYTIGRAFSSFQYPIELDSYASAFSERLIQYFLIYEYISTVFLFTAIGPDIISKDFKNHMLPFYFSKPIYVRDYIVGKLFALALVPIAVCGIPFVLWQSLRILAALPTPYISAVLLASFWTLLYEICFAFIYASIMLAVSTLTRRKSWAVFLWLMLAIIPLVLSISISNMDHPNADSLSDYFYIPGLILLSIDIAGADWFELSPYSFIGPLLFLSLGVSGVLITYYNINKASKTII